jgi:hypothetical protein
MLRRMRRAPTFVVALSAALVELVILAAAGNQWVVDHLIKNASVSEAARTRDLKAVLTAFPWRWTAENDQRMIWLGEIVAGIGMVILVFLLVYAFVAPIRAPRSFVSVWLGVWGLVLGITQVAAIGRTMIAYSELPDAANPQRLGRFSFAIFDGPTAETVLFGGVSGLIVAIVAGVVASVTSRRVDEAAEIAEEDEIPAWSAAIGMPPPAGATQVIGSEGWPGSGERVGSTQTVGSGAETTASWPPPDPADRVPDWPAPGSPARAGSTSGQPARSWSPPDADRPAQWPTRTEPPHAQPRAPSAPPSQPPRAPGRPDEPPTEITTPRTPQPTTELPRPGIGPNDRLPLPEERPPDT